MNIVSYNGDYDLILLFSITLAIVLAGTLMGLLSSNYREDYDSLSKPKGIPKSIVFSIVWTVLYILMGYTAYRIIFIGMNGVDILIPLTLFSVQLLINFLWPFVFFKYRRYKFAFILNIVLILLVVATAVSLIFIDLYAGLSLIPYILWLIYAAYLSYMIWKNGKAVKQVETDED